MTADALQDAIYKALKTQDSERLRDSFRQRDELVELKKQKGPATKDELWQWFKTRIGIELGRVSVCEGHSSQIDLVWEVYSFAVTRVLWVLSRGGGKTSLMAWVDDCQAEHFPGWESFTIGPGKNQGERKYEHLLPLVVEGGVIGGKELEHVERSTMTKTQLKNGSAMEISLGGDPANANGPRVPRLHRDETELMQNDTYKQAGNIPAGRKTRDGRYVPAQIVDTSTMKWAGGRIDLEIQAYTKSVQKGVRPRMEVRISCIFEAAAENPYCRSVPEDQRRARLVELGLDPNKICDCDTYVSDVWPREENLDGAQADEEDEPRTLQSVCQGRFFRSRGYKAFDDIQTLFLENDRETWNAEQECAEPSREGTYLRSYNQIRHGIKGYEPDPDNGPIDQAIDWGGDDQHAVLWFQTLERDVIAKGFTNGQPRLLKAGAVVCFAEIVISGIGNVALGQLVLEKESEWSRKYPGWMVRERYPDSAGYTPRADWRDHLGLETVSRIKKDFKEEVKYVRSRIGNAGRFYIDIVACPRTDTAIRGWRQENGREIHDDNSDPMAAFRYYEHNIAMLDRRKQRVVGSSQPAAADDHEERPHEREHELIEALANDPRRSSRSMEGVVVYGDLRKDTKEVMDVAAAEDSPLREEARRMGGKDDWYASTGLR